MRSIQDNMLLSSAILLPYLVQIAHGHAAPFNPSFFGFNVTAQTFDYDNRMVAPLVNMPFSKWWFHNHLSYPPHPTDITALPAGGSTTFEIACDKGATSYYASSPGGNIQNGNNPCPEAPSTAFHAHNESDAAGCAWGIAYKNNVADVKPEDFTIFSTNRVCVWTRFNEVQIPKNMPACEGGMCICAFFWIHNADAGSAQMFMNGFQCNIENATSTVPVSQGKVANFCGASERYGTTEAHPQNCTYGAKSPFYWLQTEESNIFNDPMQPPVYNELFGFADGALDDIFEDSMLPVYDQDTGKIVSYTMQGSVAGATKTAVPASEYSSSSAADASVTATPVPSSKASSNSASETGKVLLGGASSSGVPSSSSSSSSFESKAAPTTVVLSTPLPSSSSQSSVSSSNSASGANSDDDSTSSSSSSSSSSSADSDSDSNNSGLDSTSSSSSNTNSSSSGSNAGKKVCKRRTSKKSKKAKRENTGVDASDVLDALNVPSELTGANTKRTQIHGHEHRAGKLWGGRF